MTTDVVRAAIDDATQRVDKHADVDWKSVADDALAAVARTQLELTADDVLELLEVEHSTASVHNLAALGPVFMRAQKQGMIENTDRFTQSRIPRRHRKITVWRSLICDREKLEAAT